MESDDEQNSCRTGYHRGVQPHCAEQGTQPALPPGPVRRQVARQVGYRAIVPVIGQFVQQRFQAKHRLNRIEAVGSEFGESPLRRVDRPPQQIFIDRGHLPFAGGEFSPNSPVRSVRFQNPDLAGTQGGPVDLAIGEQRQPIMDRHLCRHHIARHGPCHPLADRLIRRAGQEPPFTQHQACEAGELCRGRGGQGLFGGKPCDVMAWTAPVSA